jgi:uncharacterized protein YbjQ (UPF0145 family)
MATDAYTVWAIKGQPFSFTVGIKDFTDGNLLAGGLADLVCAIAKDEATSLSAISGDATEIGATGLVRVALDETDMGADVIVGQVSTSTANAVFALFEIKPLSLDEFDGRADEQDVVKPEQYLIQLWASRMNARACTESRDSFTKADGTTEWLAGEVVQTATQIAIGRSE